MKEVTLIEKRLIEQFWARKNKPPKQIRNQDLPAGSPMYYYCPHCGHLRFTCGEGYWGEIPVRCEGCQSLHDAALIPPPKLNQVKVRGG